MKERVVALADRVIRNIVLIYQCEELGKIPGRRNVNEGQRRGDCGSERGVAGGVRNCLHGLDLQTPKPAEIRSSGTAEGAEEASIYLVADGDQVGHCAGLAI